MRSFPLLTTAAICLALTTALNAAEPGMAFVSMERLFDEYYKTKAANVQLKARFDTLDAPRRALIDTAKNLKIEVEKLGVEARDKSISDSERDKKRLAAEDKYALFREAETKLAEFDATYKKQFGDEMKQSQQKLVGEIRAVIENYAKQKGIRIVFDSSGKTLNSVEAVVYYDPSFDITETILATLNKDAGEPAGSKTTGSKSTKKTP